MTSWTLAALLVIVTLFAAYEALIIARLIRANREAATQDPAYDEANAALIEGIRASLIDRPEEWDAMPDCLTHESGARILSQPDGGLVIEHDGTASIITGELASRLIEAAQIRNARSFLKALA